MLNDAEVVSTQCACCSYAQEESEQFDGFEEDSLPEEDQAEEPGDDDEPEDFFDEPDESPDDDPNAGPAAEPADDEPADDGFTGNDEPGDDEPADDEPPDEPGNCEPAGDGAGISSWPANQVGGRALDFALGEQGGRRRLLQAEYLKPGSRANR